MDLTGAVDLHVHTAPDVYHRSVDDDELARLAADAGMRALLLKSHHVPTADRAALVRADEGLAVFGGLALNLPVGGLNPVAVETAVEMGAREIWMPTLHAAHCLETAEQEMFRAEVRRGRTGLRVTDEAGRLRSEVLVVLEIVRDAGIILGTGHLSPAESLLVLEQAAQMGLDKLLVTHPLMSFLRWEDESLERARGLGAFLELDRLSCMPGWPGAVAPAETARVIRLVGAAHCVLASDGGQAHNPSPVEMLRAFAEDLRTEGIGEEDLRKMLCENPARLLDL